MSLCVAPNLLSNNGSTMRAAVIHMQVAWLNQSQLSMFLCECVASLLQRRKRDRCAIKVKEPPFLCLLQRSSPFPLPLCSLCPAISSSLCLSMPSEVNRCVSHETFIVFINRTEGSIHKSDLFTPGRMPIWECNHAWEVWLLRRVEKSLKTKMRTCLI